MKKLFLLSILFSISFVGEAQTSFGGQVGANLGMGQSGGSFFNSSLSNTPKVGFLVGALADVPFGEKISFRPEFNFVQRGSKYGGNTVLGGSSSSNKVTLNYLELPLNFVYKMAVGSSANRLFFGAGVTFAVGIIGTQKGPNVNGDVKFDGKSNQSGPDEHFKRTDVGINVLAGYQLKMGVFGRVAYTHSLPNIDPDANRSYKNRGISLAIGYMINSKKAK